MTVKVLDGQSLFDIAMQYLGDSSAAIHMALLNGISITDTLTAGQLLVLPDVMDKDIVKYFKDKAINPATKFIEKAIQYTSIKYGLLYNWYAVSNLNKITSNDNFNVPTKNEWDNLISYLGDEIIAGGKCKEIGLEYWEFPNAGATNEINFNGRGSGFRGGWDGSFSGLKTDSMYFAKDLINNKIYLFNLYYTSTEFYGFDYEIYAGNSVRLVRAATASEQLLADGTPCDAYIGNDGKVYRTIKINDKVWLADNLAEIKFRDGSDIPKVTDNAEWAALTTAGMCAYNNDENNI